MNTKSSVKDSSRVQPPNMPNIPPEWSMVNTDEGRLYKYALTGSASRSCLVRKDKTIEVRANGLISKYPSVQKLKNHKEIKQLLEKITAARLCAATEEGYECSNVLFLPPSRTNKLCIRCATCQRARRNEKKNLKRKQERLERRKLRLDKRSKRNVRDCCIVGCNVTRPPHKLYHFPVDKERLKQWLLICVIKDDMLGNKHKYICGKHFDASKIAKDHLKKDAIPKMDAVNWLQQNTNTSMKFHKELHTTSATENSSDFEDGTEIEIGAYNVIKSAFSSNDAVDEIQTDMESDNFDGLQCKNVCHTCAKAFQECETYRENCNELEKKLQAVQEKNEALKLLNEQLTIELEECNLDELGNSD